MFITMNLSVYFKTMSFFKYWTRVDFPKFSILETLLQKQVNKDIYNLPEVELLVIVFEFCWELMII